MPKTTPRTEPLNAPVTPEAVVATAPVETIAPAVVLPPYVPPTPTPKTIERQGVRSEPYTRRYPQVRGGTCEFCGVLDKNVPAEYQYQLCPHFRGIGELRCSYCDESVDPTQIVLHAVLNIAEHPDNPNKLVVWCNSYECSRKHEARFRRTTR